MIPDRRVTGWWEITAAAVAALIVLWAAGILVIPALRFAIVTPRGAVGVESASALARLFAALVLVLFPTEKGAWRLRWIAAGLVILALGGLLFGFLNAVTHNPPSLNTSVWEWLTTRSLAGIALAIGLVAPAPPRPTRRAVVAAAAVVAALVVSVAAVRGLPALVAGGTLDADLARSHALMPGLTTLYWLLSVIPLLLTGVAAIGAVRLVRSRAIGGWLLVAMVLLAGSQLHSTFWPAVYSSMLTTADILRLLFALIVTIGGILELRAISQHRAALLAAEQEQHRRLAELSEMKSSFTAMVAHEIGSPLAAIRRTVELARTGRVDPPQALERIAAETSMLSMLMDDMTAAQQVEHPDFEVNLQPVLIDALVADAEDFARTLPGDHPLLLNVAATGYVLADRDRIGQVLRNLLGNAARYSEPATPIDLRVTAGETTVRVDVADRGPGIPLDEQETIFEKFSRGSGQTIPGAGLGLYLSRRIVHAHGSDLTVASTPGKGATFTFRLVETEPAEAPVPPIDVLLVDDHAAFRQPLAMLLDLEVGLRVVAQAGTLEEARHSLNGANVALVDLELPDGSGVTLIEELAGERPDVRCIALTATVDRRQIAQAVEAGAVAVVHKSAPIADLRDVLQRVVRGENLAQQRSIVELLQTVRQERENERAAEEALAQLTPREREVLQALAEGLSDKEIATRLGIMPATARTHVVRILGKLGVSSRLQAVVFAGRYGAIEPAPSES